MREAVETADARLLFLTPSDQDRSRPHSPYLNPIELAFYKLKILLREAANRTVPELWDSIAKAIDAFAPTEC